MPVVKCCVRECASNSQQTPELIFYCVPDAGERREKWLKLVRYEDLTSEPGTELRVCCLHFVEGESQTFEPSIFPWSKNWTEVVQHYQFLNREKSQPGRVQEESVKPSDCLTNSSREREPVGPGGSMSLDQEDNEARARVLQSPGKNRKRMRIWFDESEGEEEVPSKSNDVSKYVNSSEQILQSPENRGAEAEHLQDGNVKREVMGRLPSSNSKMSVHEKAFFSPYHSSQLVNKLTDLWRMGKMCDATVCVGYTIKIKAHKLVLSSMSSVIMKMAAKTEGAVLELQLPGDLNVEAVQKFITFLYEGVLYLSATTVHDIHRLASIFKVDLVLGYCQTFLQSLSLNSSSSSSIESQGMSSAPSSSTHLVQTPTLPLQMVAPLNTSPPTTLLIGSTNHARGSPKLTVSNPDSVTIPKRPVLRQQATVHGEDEISQCSKYPQTYGQLTGKRVQELKGMWKKSSYETSEEGSSPGLVGTDHMLSSPVEQSSTKGSPCSSFEQSDMGQVKTEPDDSATESGDEHNLHVSTLPLEPSDGMEPPDVPVRSKGKALSSEQTLANSDPALLTEQMRTVMPQTGILYENLPIPDGFLSESNPEQQRRYMASLLERSHTSAIPETQRMYRCLFCPSSFVKAKSCVVHVIETHQVLAKDVLKYVSIERKGNNKGKGKCPLCEYKVNKNNDHLHYHKYFKHGIALPEGYQLYRCEICGMESSSKYNWRTHVDTCHFQGNTCEMCAQSFNSRDELAQHYRTDHISRRVSPPKKRLRRLTKNISAPADTSQSRLYVYKCPDCSFDSSSRDDIAGHMVNVHGRDMEIPELQRPDKDRLLRTQSDARVGLLENCQSIDTEESKDGSPSHHSDYDCESPDSSMVVKETE